MPTLAIAAITDVNFGNGIVDYLRRIDDTMEPFGGRYLVHGGPKAVLEGDWPGDVVILEFPDRTSAEDWYASDAYRAIRPLRTENSKGDVILIDTVAPGHRGPDILPA
ncbi:MAG: DUF1330 domain-containing protein [Alphaproteobacteria bacterium]|nr:DUF1330 domain-containing protein [Alphaproteobacteria bacterium]